MDNPRIEEIRGGFVAIGEGWAVVAATPGEAVKRYREAQRIHREIAARPDPVLSTQAAKPGQLE